MYMGMGEMARYQGAMGGAVQYPMPHEMFQAGLSEYGANEPRAHGRGYSPVGQRGSGE